LPAGQLAGEADVLAATTDGLREPILGYRDVHAVRVFIHHDRLDFGRRHRVDDKLRRVLIPGDDIHPLAGNFVRHRLHARTAHADASADRVDARVVSLHGDLGAHAGIAGSSQDLNESLPHFGNFELEQLDQEFGRRARKEQLRAARLGAYITQEGLDAILRAHRLARNQFVARDESFGVAAEIHEYTVAVDAFDDAAHQRADTFLVLLDHLGTLGLAHLLHDDLLRGLRGDAAESDRLHRHFDELTRLRVLPDVGCVLEPELTLRKFQLRGIVREHLPAAERIVVAGLAVDRHTRVHVL